MAFPTLRSQAQCPNCGTLVTLNLTQIVDAGSDSSLRDRLLRGRLNLLSCPACGFSAPLSSPMIYHDPAHSLLLAFVPQELNLPMQAEEKEIGRLTNMLLDKTPPAERKKYMLEPTRVLSYEALLEKILVAEGIDPEAMRRQNQRIGLLVRLAQAAATDPDSLDKLLEQHRSELDREMVTMVSATISQAEAEGAKEMAAPYIALRKALIRKLGLSEAELKVTPDQAYDQLIEFVQSLPAARLSDFIQANRPAFDYPFFIHLANRIDGATGDEQARLSALRDQLLDQVDVVDNQARDAMRHAADQLQRLLQAKDVEAELQALLPDLDEAFIVVLSANIEQATAQGQKEIADLLTRLYVRVMQMLQEQMRPELRAMNEIIGIEDTAERQKALSAALGEYDAEGFIAMIEEVAANLEDAAQGDPRVVDRLYQIADEARAVQGGVTTPDPAPASSAASGILLP